jgi:hypothetical protein
MDPQQTVQIHCPYCGESLELLVDCSAGAQNYVEDCQVCCRPMEIHTTVTGDGRALVDARREDD